MTTLIAFIGKGQPINRQNGGAQYRQTVYSIGGVQSESSYFATALLKSRQYKIDHVVVIGTRTSSWAELLDECVEEADLELACKIAESTDNNTEVSDELLERLCTRVKTHWAEYGVKMVDFCCHDAQLHGNETDIQAKYLAVLSSLQEDEDALLDVTHAFRWMPYMMLAARQLWVSLGHKLKPLMIYGELMPHLPVSPMRDLRIIRDIEDISRDISLFFDRLLPYGLCERLQEEWPEGAEVILKFGERLQGNYIAELAKSTQDGKARGEILRRMKNIIDNRQRHILSPWVEKAAEKMQELYFSIVETETSVPRIALNIAQVYADRSFYGQALMAHEMVIRMLAWESPNNPEHRQMPEWENSAALDQRFAGALSPDEGRYIKRIFENRNIIAHGALTGNRALGINSLPEIFKDQQTFLHNLIRRFEDGTLF